jgi:hypothetical protein
MTDVLKNQAQSFVERPTTPDTKGVSAGVRAPTHDGSGTPAVLDDRSHPVTAAAIASQAKAVASHVGADASDLISGQIAERGQRSAGELSDVARALRSAKHQLDGNMAAPFFEKAADQIDRASKFVRTADAGEIAETLGTVARKEPLLFLGGAFVLGILGARFMKSSTPRAFASEKKAETP